MVSTTSDRNNMMTEKGNTIAITNSESETVCESCRVTAVTVGVVSAVVTGLLVAVISVAVHIAVYQYFYKPRLMIMRPSPVVQDGPGQTGDAKFMIPAQCTDEREGVTQGTSTVVVSAINGSGHPLLVLRLRDHENPLVSSNNEQKIAMQATDHENQCTYTYICC